jgi:hypothetical protein
MHSRESTLGWGRPRRYSETSGSGPYAHLSAPLWDAGQVERTITMAEFAEGLEAVLGVLCESPGRWVLIAESGPYRYLQVLAFEGGAIIAEVVYNHRVRSRRWSWVGPRRRWRFGPPEVRSPSPWSSPFHETEDRLLGLPVIPARKCFPGHGVPLRFLAFCTHWNHLCSPDWDDLVRCG